MTKLSIAIALENLGFIDGWAANDIDGIILWINDDPEPTEEELISAGWVKPTPEPKQTLEEETPTE